MTGLRTSDIFSPEFSNRGKKADSSQNGSQRRVAQPPKQDMAQVTAPAQCQPHRTWGILHPVNLYAVGVGHDGALMCDVLLLP